MMTIRSMALVKPSAWSFAYLAAMVMINVRCFRQVYCKKAVLCPGWQGRGERCSEKKQRRHRNRQSCLYLYCFHRRTDAHQLYQQSELTGTPWLYNGLRPGMDRV